MLNNGEWKSSGSYVVPGLLVCHNHIKTVSKLNSMNLLCNSIILLCPYIMIYKDPSNINLTVCQITLVSNWIWANWFDSTNSFGDFHNSLGLPNWSAIGRPTHPALCKATWPTHSNSPCHCSCFCKEGLRLRGIVPRNCFRPSYCASVWPWQGNMDETPSFSTVLVWSCCCK